MIYSSYKGDNMTLCERKLISYIPKLEFLIYDTGPSYFDYIFGSREDALRHIKSLASKKSNIFSHDLCKGYFNGDVLVGIEAGYAGHQYWGLIFHTVIVSIRLYGFIRTLPKIFRSMIVSFVSPKIEHSAYYIAFFSVASEFRGLGYGLKMIELATKRISATGYSCCLLDVEYDNKPAIRLYESIGFKRENDVTNVVSVKLKKILNIKPRYRMKK